MLVIYLIGAGMLRKFKIPPDSEPDPEQVVAVNARFRCVVCGAEVTMTAAQDTEELDAPRHCREDMERVGPIASLGSGSSGSLPRRSGAREARADSPGP